MCFFDGQHYIVIFYFQNLPLPLTEYLYKLYLNFFIRFETSHFENKFIFLLSQEDKEVNKVLAACIHEWIIIHEELYPSQNRN